MNNLLLLPVVIPMFIGVILIFFVKNIRVQRAISVIGSLALLIASVYLAFAAYESNSQVLTLELGNWQAPFGIVLVGDMLATLLVALAGIVGLFSLLFAFQSIGEEREKSYFYSFFFFLLTGVNGAFLTGDLFNLFVFFEVMLISSYVLIVHGGTKFQLRESFKYMVINMVASIFFLVGVAYIYAVTGTLNMADLAEKVGVIGQDGMLNVIAIIFLIVFAMKGAFFPLYFWLPNAYAGPPAVVTALFAALLTKVGIYSIFRSFTLIFIHDREFTHTIILILAGLTMIFGVLGALSQFNINRILNFQIISQVGFMALGIGLYSPLAIAASVYYIVHDIIIKAALFFTAGATEKVAGTSDLKKMSGLLKTHPWLGWLFFITAMSFVGIPPLSGFFGKFGLVLGGIEVGTTLAYILVAVVLLVSLLNLLSMMRIFMKAFWGEKNDTEPKITNKQSIGLLRPIIPLVALSIVLGLGSEPAFQYALAIADQILDPSIYIDAVLSGK
ncbi:Na+/H+ antiporter subunit D [Aquibacillus koreensis]|uniref:Na+/H+ antiporter subunit D n=1 Tax=Aquibacillus koreensis TaxID=279446 RepID=A0A9X3WLL4_9BACI|nr:Na+/H+ antiporter subunit D [Aquibacillus koreensis]MCT2538198.1 Na+/H+ antiporter subunit D [Aquibacillus koreensis]MDC3420858.1 Na+/H+ antiporter subunit D [Aquibacillus koreensis]